MYMGEAVHKGVRKAKYKYSKNVGSSRHWTYVIRANKEKRLLIAEGMEKAIKNSKRITYNNGKKSTRLYDDTKPLHFDCSKLEKKSYTNCCNLASVCCRYAGLKTPKALNSLKLNKQLAEVDGFTVLKFSPDMELKRGDILASTTKPKPHTAVIL